MRIVHRPRRQSVAVALVPGALAVVGLAVDLVAFALGLAGLGVVGVAALRGSRRGVSVGGVVAFLGVVYAGVGGTDPGLALLSTAGIVVTWTAAQHVVGLARQLGRDAPVTRSVLAHVAGATIATLVAGGLALTVFLTAGGGIPPAAIVLLLIGAAMLIFALEP